MKQWIGLCSVCWALAAGTVWAAPQETALDEVTVTATRTENTVRGSAAVIRGDYPGRYGPPGGLQHPVSAPSGGEC